MTQPAFQPQWLDSSEREHMFNLHPVRSKQVPLLALAVVYRFFECQRRGHWHPRASTGHSWTAGHLAL